LSGCDILKWQASLAENQVFYAMRDISCFIYYSKKNAPLLV